MAATTTVVETFYRVSTLLHDMDPQFTRWTSREMVDWFNDAVRALSKWVPPACSRIDTIKLVAGTKQNIADIPAVNIIRGDGLTATRTFGTMLYRVLRNMGSSGSTPGRAIKMGSIDQLDHCLPMWHTETASIIEDCIYDPRTPTIFYVNPGIASGASVWVDISYSAQPDQLVYVDINSYIASSSDSTVLPVPDLYLEEIVNYMCARAFMKDSDTPENMSLAQAYSEIFVSSINALSQQYTGTNPNLSRLPFAPVPTGLAR